MFDADSWFWDAVLFVMLVFTLNHAITITIH